MPILGLISDTHGLLRPEAVRALSGSDLIIHAGDVGGPEILDALRALAPVVAVRGNVDTGPWASSLPATAVAEMGRRHLCPTRRERTGSQPRGRRLRNSRVGTFAPTAQRGAGRRPVCQSRQRGSPQIQAAHNRSPAGSGPGSMGSRVHRFGRRLIMKRRSFLEGGQFCPQPAFSRATGKPRIEQSVACRQKFCAENKGTWRQPQASRATGKPRIEQSVACRQKFALKTKVLGGSHRPAGSRRAAKPNRSRLAACAGLVGPLGYLASSIFQAKETKSLIGFVGHKM